MNKWEIWEYTLPQITELIKATNRHIQFEVETRVGAFGGLFGAVGGGSDNGGGDNSYGEVDELGYRELTEDDLGDLIAALSGK